MGYVDLVYIEEEFMYIYSEMTQPLSLIKKYVFWFYLLDFFLLN